MDTFLKFIGLDRRKDEPKTHSDYTKRMDEWLEKNVPKYEPKVSLRKKLWDLTWIGTFAVGTLYLYMVDIQKFPRKRDIRRYRFFTGAVMVCLGLLLVSRWTDQGPYRYVEIEQEPGESNLDVRKRYFKEKLFPPETKESFDKFSKLIKGKEVKSEESSSTDSKTSSDSEKSS